MVLLSPHLPSLHSLVCIYFMNCTPRLKYPPHRVIPVVWPYAHHLTRFSCPQPPPPLLGVYVPYKLHPPPDYSNPPHRVITVVAPSVYRWTWLSSPSPRLPSCPSWSIYSIIYLLIPPPTQIIIALFSHRVIPAVWPSACRWTVICCEWADTSGSSDSSCTV